MYPTMLAWRKKNPHPGYDSLSLETKYGATSGHILKKFSIQFYRIKTLYYNNNK
jgi:hypothetical protein